MTDLYNALLFLLGLGGGILVIAAVVGAFLAFIWLLDRAYDRWKYR